MYNWYVSYIRSAYVTTITTAELRGELAELLNRSRYGKERLLITRRGNAIAAIVPVGDLALLEALEDRIDIEDAKKAIAETHRKGGIRWAEIKGGLAP